MMIPEDAIFKRIMELQREYSQLESQIGEDEQGKERLEELEEHIQMLKMSIGWISF